MKRILFFVSVIVLSVTAGCIFSGDDKKDEPKDVIGDEAKNESAEKYYPMKVGARWIYDATVSRINANDTTYTDIYEITESVIHNDISYFVERRDIGGYGELFIYLRTAENILYGIDFNKSDEELTYLNFNLSLGESWAPTATVLEETFDGIIDVKVPAGTFKNCIKFIAEGFAVENNIRVKNLIKEYYAADVGRVKSIFIKTDTAGNIVFSEIAGLTSYVIPE